MEIENKIERKIWREKEIHIDRERTSNNTNYAEMEKL